jgi:hypothetical protein
MLTRQAPFGISRTGQEYAQGLSCAKLLLESPFRSWHAVVSAKRQYVEADRHVSVCSNQRPNNAEDKCDDGLDSSLSYFT